MDMFNRILACVIFIVYLLKKAYSMNNEVYTYAAEGDNITLKCESNNIDHWENTNNISLIIYCYEFREHFIPSARLKLTEECNLQIQILTPDYRSTYRCIIAGDPPLSKDFRIRMLKPPSEIKVLEANMTEIVSGIEDHEMTLTCIVNSGEPAETIFWITKEQEVLSGGPGMLNYTFIPQQKDNWQIYTCKANNSLNGVPLEKNVQLRLTLIPRISLNMKATCLRKTMTASLYCSETSELQVNSYNWIYNGDELLETSNELQITLSNNSNDGGYTCTANNEAGSDNASLVLQYDTLCKERVQTEGKDTDKFTTIYIVLLVVTFTAVVVVVTSFLIKRFFGLRQQPNEEALEEEEDMNGTAATNQLYHSMSDLLAQPGASGHDTDVHPSFQRYGVPYSNHKVSYNLKVKATATENKHRNSNGSFNPDRSPTLPADQKISQCLKYVEVLFDPFPMGHKFVIRGSENRKPYALIDFDAHAEPLPSSSESSSTSDLQLYDEENIDDNVE